MKDNVKFVEKFEDYSIYAVKTPLVLPLDDLKKLFLEYAAPSIEDGDITFLSEKMVAITQGRLFFEKSVQPRWLAKVLCKFVKQTSFGPGLGLPMTMQIAIWEVGGPRILAACVAGFFGRIFRQKGWFHIVAGRAVSGIDGMDEATIPPFNKSAILIPAEPDNVAKELSALIGGKTVAIVDVNDLGSEVLGLSNDSMDRRELADKLLSNPLGQVNGSTPIGIIRPEK